MLEKVTLNTAADAGEKRGRDDEATAELLREAERLLLISATAPLVDLSAMIVRLLDHADENRTKYGVSVTSRT